MIKSKQQLAIFQAITAAAAFGMSSPISKFLLEKISPMLMAALLYLGAGIGMLLLNLIKSSKEIEQKEAKITKKELPFVVGMIVLDIGAPIFLMMGLTMTTASNSSLLSNFEIVVTALIALLVFKEAIGKRLWIAIFFITISSIVLSVNDFSSFSFSTGSIFILMGCICWGFENNCTRMLSLKDPMQIVIIKGLGAGLGALIIAFITKQYACNIVYALVAMALGFVAYGLSIYLYVMAQRELGAARTSAYYAISPFIGVGLSLLMYHEQITYNFIVAVILMIFGTYYAAVEKHNHNHIHEIIEHEHRHTHDDNHHTHTHDDFEYGEHSHEHIHDEIEHDHDHTPDMHHINHSH